MQERQVTIGKQTHAVPLPFLVMATQNPIESEGTYALPEAQVDRFMLKVVVDYPAPEDELTVIERALAEPVEVEQLLSLEALAGLQAAAKAVYVDPAVSRYALAIASATRRPAEAGLEDLGAYVDFGASPRGPINLVVGARALALLRGRRYVLPQDVRELAKDVLRHRLVLSYEARAEGVDADRILDRVLETTAMPQLDLSREAVA
jgi:MoxR-like ATPase